MADGNIAIQLSLDAANLDTGIKQASASLAKFRADLGQTATSVKRMEEAQFSLGTKFRHLVTTLGQLRFAVMDINDVFVRLPMSILKTAGELERTQTLLSGLSDKMTKVARDAEGAVNFKYITELSKQAPYSIGALSDAFVKLKSGGLDPAAGSLKTMVDSVSRFGGTSETLQRANIAIQQMLGKGNISMEELRQQLGEAVPSAMREMSIGMGLSMAALTKAVSKGTVEASDAINKMLTVMSLRNAGAAADMMKTWGGALSQLKTEWELTTVLIADAGLGLAAKDAVKDLKTALQSLEFKRFAVEVGSGLGSFVNAMRAFVEHGTSAIQVIKTLAVAWMAFKVSSAVITEGHGKALAALTAKYKEAGSGQIAHLNEGLAQARQQSIAKAQLLTEEVAAQRAASAAKIATMRAEILYRTDAMNAQRAQSVSTQVETINPANRTAKLFQRPQVVVGDAVNEALVARQAAVIAAANDDLRKLSVAHSQLGVKAYEAAGQLQRATAATTSVGLASVIAARGIGVLNLAYSALGGPLGLINIAIMAGIALWMNWESAAAAAERRARGIKFETADKKQLDEELAMVGALQAKRDAAFKNAMSQKATFDAATASASKRGIELSKTSPIAMSYKAAEDAYRLAQGDLDASTRRIAQTRNVAEKNEVAGRVDDIKKGFENRISSITDGSRQEQSASDKVFIDRIAAAKNNQKERDALAEQQGTANKQIVLKWRKEELRLATDESAKLAGRLDAESLSKKAYFDDRVKEYTDAVNSAEKALLPNVITNNKTPRGLTPIERAIESARARLAEARAEISALSQGIDEVSLITAKMDGAEARIRSRAKGGLLDAPAEKQGDPKVLPSNAQINKLAEIERQAVQAEEIQAVAEDLRKRLIASKTAAEEAGLLLADPLGLTRSNAKINAVKVQFAKIRTNSAEQIAEIEKINKGMKLGDIEKGITGSLALEDTAKLMTDLKAQHREATGSMVEDSRQAARAHKEAALDRWAAQTQAAINGMKAEGVASATILSIERQFSETLGAKKALLAQEYQSPMDKMVGQWGDSTRNMEEATARWAQGTIDAFVNMAKTGKMEWGSLVTQILADILKIQLQKQLAGAMSSAGNWAVAAGKAYFGFADGGVMTDAGSMPLRKYAAGGIAKSPQVALYGEGSMNEAYVPLPDGRSIPVTMAGGGGGMGNVIVNVINQTSQPVTASKGQPRMDGKQMILDVVLSAVSQPGGFRDGMRGSLGAA